MRIFKWTLRPRPTDPLLQYFAFPTPGLPRSTDLPRAARRRKFLVWGRGAPADRPCDNTQTQTALGSPGTELSTWSIGSLCCIRAIQRSRIASRPLRSYTAIQRYTALYTIQLYIAIHYTGYTTPLCLYHLSLSLQFWHRDFQGCIVRQKN